MPVLIHFDSRFGNTARLVEAVAEGFGAAASVIRVARPRAQKVA